MTVQTDLQTALDVYIQSTFTGTLPAISAEKRNLEDLLKIQQSLIDAGGADTTATGTITTQNLVPAGAATAGSAVSIDLDSKGTVTIQVTGTYTGALSAQITTDGTNWVTPTNTVFKNMVTGANSVTIPSASVGIWQIEVIGHAKFRLSALAAVTGTATISLRAAANTSQVSVAGGATAANQTTGNASLTTIDTKLPSNLTVTATRLLVDGSGVTQPVSGTVTANLGTIGGIATETTLSALNIKVPANLTVTSNRLLVDGSGVTQPVSGTFWQATQPVSIASLPALATGTNAIGSITNTSFGISGTLPAFAATPTFNIGTVSRAASAPTTSVASSATSVTLLALNANRRWASFRNDSTSVAYIAKSGTASASSVYQLEPQGYLYFDDYTGIVTAIWVSANGFMRIEEGT